ncbi:hypothetical protein TBR22_A18700 [Luteitalea sp. TBR-22]|uniref:hypothetical protein n=1 Tax=Luteitalea sp. TBR-22 TaxID=2802971 RepID=UPI001AF8D61E|nr:hypothetical protein [Luteitalea sp. TBR-22]BCS32656.1 hypothetical protein TBR22_A18700 [Luteitalea sp. TBR-22]
MRVFVRLALSAIAALLCECSARAQDVEQADVAPARPAHAARLAANPPGLSLVVRTALGKLRFAQGERLTLDLEFRDDSGARPLFDAIAYDRSGRLGIDRVVVVPASGVEDPLRDYYRAMGFGFVGGGMATPPAPLDGLTTLSLDVNEHVRFVRPGTYVLYVESHRFRDANVTPPRDPVVVVSNLLTLQITAPVLDAGAITMLPSRALRFAEGPRAAEELARRILRLEGEVNRVGTEGHELRFGLYGTQHRTEALKVLREGLATASRAVNDAIPAIAAFLDVMIAMPRDTQEDQPDQGTGAALRARERMRRYACQVSYWQGQALAAGLRGGPADVARASVSFTDEPPAHCPPAPPVNVAGVLPAVFDRLDSAQQGLMLSYRWGHVAGPSMLPVLRQLVSAPDVEREARDAALVRLGELAPDEAARLSREDVVAGRFRFSTRALRLASADTPALTQALERHLADARAQSTPLSDLQDGQGAMARGLLPTIVRLATPRTCAALVEWPNGEPASCAARASVVACALAVDGEGGPRLLREHLSDSRSYCRDELPDTLARVWPQHVPESALVEALWHERSRVAASAARALARIGTASARVALWRRLEAWHQRWEGRADELHVTMPSVDDPASQELGLARALREALLRGRGWLTTAEDRLRVRDSCVTQACRQEFSPFVGGPPVRLVVVESEEWTGQTVYRADGQAFHTLHDLLERLVLYPKAVTIAWRAGSSHAQARAAALYEALATAAAERGLAVLAQPPPVTP